MDEQKGPDSGVIPARGRKMKPARKYLFLLISLSVLVAMFPFTFGHPIGIAILQIVFIVVIFAIVHAVAKYDRHKLLARLFGLVVIGARIAIFVFPEIPVPIEALMTAMTLVFFSWVIVVLLRDILAEGAVTTDKISGAISVYLIIGFTWGFLFGFMEMLHPGSFLIPRPSENPYLGTVQSAPAAPGQPVSMGHMIGSHHGNYLFYFSFITFTSTGYGDVVPITPPARTFAWLEAVFGQFYLAVLVARLVGLQIASSMASREIESGRGPGHE